MRVVVVDEELPYPANSGKRIRTLNLLRPLAERHQIVYLCYRGADAAETNLAVDYFREWGIETVLVDRVLPLKSGPGFYGRLFWNLASPLPYSVQTHNSRALRRAIRGYAAAHDVDLWHCEWTPYAESIHSLGMRHWVMMAHNVESLIWQRYGENETGALKRWYIAQQWRKFERFERRMCFRAPRTIAVSSTDARWMRERFGATRIDVVDNGVDAAYFQPKDVSRDARRVLFLGSLDWRPNQDGVALLLDRIFPAVIAQEPAARLTIVGRKPPEWMIRRVRECSSVELCADVPDVRPFLSECGLLAVPLRIGGGSRLKILEGLACECPVIATRVGAEGLELQPGRHFVEAEIDAMATAIVRQIRDPEPIRAMARAGRRVVANRYGWAGLANRLEKIWIREAVGR